jgi:hypothetical protein
MQYLDISAPSPTPACPPVICPEGFKVALREDVQLKTPEESSAVFKERFKGMLLSYPNY